MAGGSSQMFLDSATIWRQKNQKVFEILKDIWTNQLVSIFPKELKHPHETNHGEAVQEKEVPMDHRGY